MTVSSGRGGGGGSTNRIAEVVYDASIGLWGYLHLRKGEALSLSFHLLFLLSPFFTLPIFFLPSLLFFLPSFTTILLAVCLRPFLISMFFLCSDLPDILFMFTSIHKKREIRKTKMIINLFLRLFFFHIPYRLKFFPYISLCTR